MRVRTNGLRQREEEATEREGRVKMGGNKGYSLGGAVGGLSMPGTELSAAAPWTGGSVQESEQKQQFRDFHFYFSLSLSFSYITAEKKGRREPRVQLGHSRAHVAPLKQAEGAFQQRGMSLSARTKPV